MFSTRTEIEKKIARRSLTVAVLWGFFGCAGAAGIGAGARHGYGEDAFFVALTACVWGVSWLALFGVVWGCLAHDVAKARPSPRYLIYVSASVVMTLLSWGALSLPSMLGIPHQRAGLIGLIVFTPAVKVLTTMAVGSGAFATVMGTDSLAKRATPNVEAVAGHRGALFGLALFLLFVTAIFAWFLVPLQWFHVD